MSENCEDHKDENDNAQTSVQVLRFEDFVSLHMPQLQASAVPEKYWLELFSKLKDEVLDAGNSFMILQEEGESGCKTKVVVSKTDGIAVDDPQHIYLVDHAWTYKVNEARLHLEKIPGLLERISLLMDIDTEDQDKEDLLEKVLGRMWKYNQTYSFGNFSKGTDEALPVWYILDEFGSRINHSDEPSFRAVPFYYMPLQMAFTLIWPLRNLEEGDEVTRDYVESCGADAEKRRAKLIPWETTDMKDVDYSQTEPDRSFWETFQKTESIPVVEAECKPLPRDRPLKVYTEYRQFKSHLTDDKFVVVDSEEEADILWFFDHYKTFRTLSENCPWKFINQFPMECLFTVKDLLAVVSRRAGPECTGPGCMEWGPKWLPETFDLQTELSKFISYYQHREERGLDNHWICKPWNMARSLDSHVTNNLDYIIRVRDSGPKVACKYVEDPVLFYREEVGSVKFDIRYIVLLNSVKPLTLYVYKVFWLRFANREEVGSVKFDIRYIVWLNSVKPLTLYIYKVFWLRFANRPFSLDHLDEYEKHFTVMNYQEGVTLKQINCEDFVPMFEKQYPDISWDNLEKTFFQMFKEISESATCKPPPFGLPHSPQSRGMYAIDFLLKWKEDDEGVRCMQPVLCEVNFSADCERACKYHPNFANDIFNAMFLDDVEGRPITKL